MTSAMIIHLIKRLLLVLLGYSLATLASAIVVGVIFTIDENQTIGQLFGVIAFTAMLIGIYAAVPAGITVIASEIVPWRGRLIFIIAATLIGAVLPIIVGLPHWYILVGIGFGPVAGLIYWSVAGRSAGFRMPAAA